VLAGFVAELDPVNARADAADGFVWRLQTEDGDATAIRGFDDDRVVLNMSVWESLEALRAFVYGDPAHLAVMRRRREWFERIDVFMVLW
jgi:heme-degrading monooxygenase HmoA